MLTVFDALEIETPSTVKLAFAPPCDVLNFSAVDVDVSVKADVIVRSPRLPDVPLTRLNREPFASVITFAVTPIPAWLIAAASPVSVLLFEPTLIVCAVPLPTCNVIDPDKVSLAFAIESIYPLDVCASELTTIVCVPAVADDVAAVS